MMDEKEKRKIRLTTSQALPRIQNFCAYQERCHQEVRDKLYSYSLSPDDVEQIIAGLIEENFLNEERFAESYVSGKFKIKKWGRNKILAGLKNKKISAYCIKKGMLQIDPDEYEETLKQLAEKKFHSTKGMHPVLKQKKTVSYLISRGYESDLCWMIVKALMNEK